MNSHANFENSENTGELLKIARNSLGLTLQSVGDQLGLSVSTLSEIERGKRKTSSIELFKLSKIYRRPIDYFLMDCEAHSSFSALYRAAENESVSKDALIKFQDLCNNYRFITQVMKVPETTSLPDYSERKQIVSQAEAIAEEERRALRLDGQPIKDIVDLLESRRGVKIFHMPEIGDGFSGAMASDKYYGTCFLINADHPQVRRIFTIAHEYAHSIAHRNQQVHIDFVNRVNQNSQQEKFADSFAAAFLMPKGAVDEFVDGLCASNKDIDGLVILRVAIYFGVSFTAAGWRLFTLQKLSRQQWEKIRQQHIPTSPVAKAIGYRDEGGSQELLPRRYKYLCYKAYEKGDISLQKLAELLNRNYFDLKQEIEADSLIEV